MKDKLVIEVTQQRRGLNFTLAPESQDYLDEISGADPSRSNIFIGFEEHEGFEDYALDSIENQVVILLTGLTVEQLSEHVEEIEFQRMPSGDTQKKLQTRASR
ncbi:MAG: hypothetical protein ABEL76_02525 [Bradymonadaceae bacterium]